jgi:hypothetical protein
VINLTNKPFEFRDVRTSKRLRQWIA